MNRRSFFPLLAGAPLLAQTPAPPPRQFLLRIEPLRAGFALNNMTPEEMGLAQQHAAYLKGLLDGGQLALAGQAFPAGGLFGIIIVNAPDAAAAQELLEGDPAVKGRLFRGEVIPFRTVFARPAAPPH